MAQLDSSRLFLGRKRELEALSEALDATKLRRPSLWLLAGEAGIGKTRTAQELADRAREQGVQVLWARALEGDVEPAYWLWSQSLGSLGESQEPEALARWTADRADEVGRLVPAVRALGDGPPQAGERAPEDARMRFFDAVGRFLGRVGVEVPLLIVLDDLHWADPPSLLMLEFVASHLQETGVMIVGTYRDAALQAEDAVSRCLGRLSRVGQRLPLVGLPEAEVGSYVAEMAGRPAESGLVARIAEATGGNPFFVSELVRLLSAEGRLDREEGPAAGLPLPSEVRHAVRRRLDALSGPCRRALEVASVLGAEPSLPLLEALLGEPRESVLGHVEEALDFGLLAPLPGALGRFRFSHGIVCEVLYADLGAGERARLHRRAGEALKATGDGAGELTLVELSRHFFEAARLGDPEPAVQYATRAARQCLDALAYEQAVIQFERALEAASGAPPDETRRAQLLAALGDAIWRTGSDPERCRAVFEEAARIAEARGDAELLARAAYLYTNVSAETGVADPVQISLLEKALDALGDVETPLRVQVQMRLASALYFTRAEERRDALSAAAVELARKLGDPEALAGALINRHFTRWGPAAHASDQLEVAREAAQVAQQAGLMDLELEARAWIIFDQLELADIEGFLAELEAHERRGRAARTPRFLWHVALVRACRTLLVGDLAEAERLAEAARDLGAGPEPATAAQFFGIQLYEIRRSQGRGAELAPVFEQFSRQYGETMPVWTCAHALARAEEGDLPAARAELARLATLGFRELPRDANWLVAMSVLAQVCRITGEVEPAASLYEQLLPQASRMVVIATSAVCYGAVDHALGLLASCLGRVEDAVSHFEQALAIHERMGGPILAARTQVELAALLREQGTDPERAAALARSASATVSRLGLGPLAPLGGAGAPELAPEPGAPRRARMLREGEYWTIEFNTSVRLKDRKGLRYLRTLLESPDREFHAFDLVQQVEGAAPGEAPSPDDAVAVGDSDAGERLDPQARAAYEERLREIVPDLEEAESHGDIGRAERLRTEMDALTQELAGAFGLGGRARKSGSLAERARVNVTRAIRGLLKKLEAEDPELGRTLGTTISTGLFCVYRPDPRFPVDWEL